MDRQQAIRIVKETLQNPFDRERYRRFIKELLNHIDEEGARNNQGNLIPKAYQEYVGRLERIGKYFSNGKEIMLFIVYLKKETSIERARSMQRNFIAGYLSGKHGGTPKDAALAAFVSPNSADWRFSLIKMEYSIGQTAKGRPKIEEEFTPARRWSFLVGPNEKSHTAQTRLVPLVMDDVNGPSLEELEEAFNIEKVTNEFFTEYRNLFIRTKEELDRAVAASPQTKSDFESKGVNTVDFAKKLLGQIVFLYFLQKKGWFGVPRAGEWGSGSKNFLRELFAKKHGDYANFFNDILEPLFYEALRTGRQHDGHYYSRFNCKIPFLNGGLFDPIGNYDWVKTDILLPDELFSNTRKTKGGDTGDGILDIFDRYNFTVREDEPYEKEVAIDPELLGKAYEKFNAIRPDNFNEYFQALNSGKKGEEGKFNKQYGVYYTPREIVHYMCRQSLINYLYTGLNPGPASESNGISREDIEALIYHGESVGEHEAQVISQGRETGRYSHLLPESIRIHAEALDEKLARIRVCDPAVGSGAFPVGMMGEIVRARSLLATFLKKGKTLYDFKRECIENSLYGVDIDPGAVEIAKLRLWLSLVVDEDDIQNIKPLPNLDYKIVCGNSLVGVEKNLFNHQFFNELETLKPLYFNETNPTEKQKYRKQIDGLIDQITNGRAEFDFEIYFSEVFHEKGGFDVVIGNPPYINVELVSREIKEIYIKKYSTFYKRYDVFGLFFELSLKNLVKKGMVAFIVPSQILNNLSFKKLRELMLNNHWLKEVFYLGDRIFESANNDVCVLFLNKPKVDTIHLVNALDFLNQTVTEVAVTYFDKFNGIISFSANSSSDSILDKIFNSNFQPIRQNFDVFQGIVTGNNNLYILTPEQAEEAKIEPELLYPVLLGRDFEKWMFRNIERRILYLDSKIDIKEYPNTEKWLLPHKKTLSMRRECINGVIPWYGLQWARDKSKLDYIPKILVQGTRNPRLKTRIVATLDTIGIYGTQGLNFILPIHDIPIKFLLAILNSALINYIYLTKFLNVAIKAEFLKDTPIPITTSKQQQILIELVDQILIAKRENPTADIIFFERKIDQIVYELYGLTEEEIRIVERVSN